MNVKMIVVVFINNDKIVLFITNLSEKYRFIEEKIRNCLDMMETSQLQ